MGFGGNYRTTSTSVSMCSAQPSVHVSMAHSRCADEWWGAGRKLGHSRGGVAAQTHVGADSESPRGSSVLGSAGLSKAGGLGCRRGFSVPSLEMFQAPSNTNQEGEPPMSTHRHRSDSLQ